MKIFLLLKNMVLKKKPEYFTSYVYLLRKSQEKNNSP